MSGDERTQSMRGRKASAEYGPSRWSGYLKKCGPRWKGNRVDICSMHYSLSLTGYTTHRGYR